MCVCVSGVCADGLSVLLDVLSVIQSHSSSQMNHTDFKLLYHGKNREFVCGFERVYHSYVCVCV